MRGNTVTPAKGLRDWIIQRLSAIYMAVYFIFLVICFFVLPNSYQAWQNLFANTWMLIANILFLGLLIWHAWIGMWTIITDYIKPENLRIIVKLIIWLVLFACFIWGVNIFIHIHMLGSV